MQPDVEQREIADIQVEGLNFAYSSVEIFRNFCWAPEGRLAVLEGPSGCGKTTLLRLLAGHLRTSSWKTWRVPEITRLVLQDDALFPWLSAESNLVLVSEWPGLENLPTELQPLGREVSLYADQVVASLSFGQRRLVELLRVLACPAPLLLLDEPLSFLDHAKRVAVIDAVRALAERGVSFVITSHYETDFGDIRYRRFRFEGDAPFSHLDFQHP